MGPGFWTDRDSYKLYSVISTSRQCNMKAYAKLLILTGCFNFRPKKTQDAPTFERDIKFNWIRVEQRVSLASDSVDTSYATALRFLNALPELDDRAILQSSLSTCLAPCTLWLTTVQSWQSSPRKNLHFDPISAGDAEYKKLVMLAFNFSPSLPLACQCFWMAIPCVYLGACMFSCEWPSKDPYLQEKSSLLFLPSHFSHASLVVCI